MAALLRASLLLPLAAVASADTITIEADRDNTLYQTDNGSLSNGSGERLFSGVTDTGFLRRAVLRFDVSVLPLGASIQSVTLDMRVSKVPLLPPPTVFELHRVTVDWGEGASDAAGEEGTGDASQPGDATWLHTFYPLEFWTKVGGDFDPIVSAKTTHASGLGPISWSAKGMVADVRAWVNDPGGNFGWLIKAEDELDPRNAKRFNSREFMGDPTTRPRLTIVFDPVPPKVPPVPACNAQVFCDTNPDNEAAIGVDNCLCSGGSVLVTMTGAEPGRFGYLLVGSGSGTIVDPPGAMGDLCLDGSPVGRFAEDTGITDSSGSLTTDILNANSGGGGGNIPSLGGSFCSPPGQTWNFQYWYRGSGPSRLSQALRVTLY